MKTVRIKSNPINLVRETKEERLERIHSSNLRTRVVKSKKIYDRNKFKNPDYNS